MSLTRAQVREVDRRAVEDLRIPGLVLMENAGRGAADLLVALGIPGPVVICCGKGNNGGDGLVIARHLVLQGFKVRIFLCAEPAALSTDAAAEWATVTKMTIPAEIVDGAHAEQRLADTLARSAWVVDSLFGTGLTGAVRSPHDRIIGLINNCSAPVLAVDIPSGLDSDHGLPLGATVRANHTATFVAPKVGFADPRALPWLGKVHVVDIGCDAASPASSP